MKWISVEEKLPQIGTCVLTWKPRGHDLVTYSVESDRHREFIRKDGQWWDSGSRITHWMPLPEPPK
jgi:hypothetical protein